MFDRAHCYRTACLVGWMLALVLLLSPAAHAQVWNGPGTDWNTAANWNPNTVPNSASAAVTLGSTSVGTVNISASVQAQSLSFTNVTGSYTLTSGAGQTLSGINSITVAAGVTGIQTINLANVTTGNLLFPSNITLSITNNSTAGGVLSFGSTTVIGTPLNTGVIFAGPGAITFNGSFAISPNNVVGGFTKFGPGSLDYLGNGTNLGGTITLNGGTLNFDYLLSIANKASGALSLNGGVLQFTANASNPVTQSFTATSLNAGQTDVAANGGAGTITFNAGAITRSAGATADLSPSAAGPNFSIQTSTGNSTAGLLGSGPAYATVNGGANWAVQSGVVVAGLAGFSTNIFTSGANTDVTANDSPSGGGTTNSLRFNTGNQTVTFSGINTLQSGGILVTPNATGATIMGGTLTASSSGELLVHVYDGAGLIINSALVSTTGLTKAGPDMLTLGGNNSGLTGPINVNRGGLAVTTTAAVNNAGQINFNDDRTVSGAVAHQTFTINLGNSVNGTISPPIRFSTFSTGDYGTYLTTGTSTGSTVTLGGVLSSAPGLNTPIRFTGDGSDTSGFNLINTNTFMGNISLFQGFLGINSDASLGNPANTLSLEVGDNSNGGLIFLNSGITLARPMILTFNTRIVSNGADSNTIGGAIAGLGSLIKAGTGTLTLANSANTFSGGTIIFAGTLSLGSTGSLANGTSMNVSAGATFNPGTTSGQTLGTLTLSGGTFRSTALNGNFVVNQLVTGPSGGTVDFTGAGFFDLQFSGVSPSISINGTSTWLSPSNSSRLFNATGTPVLVTVQPGVTLNNGIALAGAGGFRIAGGGTFYQNSDANNLASMNAPITVAAATTFRITDVIDNSGLGNFGFATFTLDGGTVSYGGISAVSSKPLTITANNGTIQIESAAVQLFYTGAISGSGTLIKTGPGNLLLANGTNAFSGLTINAGTLQVLSDSALGTAPGITINPAGTLLYSSSTSSTRTFNLNGGALSVVTGATLTLNGGAINGGFLRGPGTFALTNNASLNGVTTFNSANITQSGPATANNFTNGGTLTSSAAFTYNGGTNTASGILNVNGALSTFDFTNDGVINVGSAATLDNFNSNLYLGGGARMYIGTQASPGGTLTLHGGTTLEVNGALLVNDGAISGTVDVNFGGQAQGIGTYGTVNVSYGGLYQPGFASSAIPGNGAIVSGLAGSGTIDNATAGGNMALTITGNSVSTFSGPIQNTTGTLSLAVQGTTSLTLLTTPLPGGGQSTNTYAGGTSIANGGTLIIGAPGALPAGGSVVDDGSFIVNANSAAGQISGSGTLQIAASTTLTSDGINMPTSSPLINGVLVIRSNAGASAYADIANRSALVPGTSKVAGLTFGVGGSLDLKNNGLIIEATGDKATLMATLAAEIHSGVITSSTALSSSKYTVALADNADLGFSFFGGLPVDPNSIIITEALKGDGNLDGIVAGDDFDRWFNNNGSHFYSVTKGDYTGDGLEAGDDFDFWFNNNGSNLSGSPAPQSADEGTLGDGGGLGGAGSTPVPEPESLVLLGPGVLGLLRRRKRSV